MTEQSFQVKFKGEMRPGADAAEVRRGLARMYGVKPERVESLFSGKAYVLKVFPSREQAERFRRILEDKTGAVAFVEPEQGAPVDTKPPPSSSAVTTATEPAGVETRFRVVFCGDLEYGRQREDVLAELSVIYRVKPERLEHLFSGKPVVIRGSMDFVGASRLMARFRGIGALCRLEAVPGTSIARRQSIDGEDHYAAPEPAYGVETSEPQPVRAGADLSGAKDSAQRIRASAETLYRKLDEVFAAVKLEHRIDRQTQAMEKNESALGCLFLVIMAGLVALVIWSPLKWYQALMVFIGLAIALSPTFKKWDTRYIDEFLRRMGEWMQRDFPFFIAALKKWSGDLPANDRARPYLESRIEELLAQAPGRRDEYEHCMEVLTGEKPRKAMDPGSTPSSADRLLRRGGPRTGASGVTCPRCGSQSITEGVRGFSWKRGIGYSLFLGPLGGAFAGSAGEGSKEYVCQNCGKKWLKGK
ncbi:MAG: hypothetical protein RB296_09855 [Acidobacteriota bacterium]|jgi:predicted RNA-binding Zn-ribbon protein involved in translation (DUF1610 family)|nr:hypothetical protein [Acidobacteriota bacterium]